MTSSTTWPEARSDAFVINDFAFNDGRSLPDLRLHYQTIGELRKDSNGNATNAVLLLHSTTGSSEGFFRDSFAGRLFNPSQPLSAERYYLIIPDSIGHGRSSKPSNGLRAAFPRYGYTDMVRAQHLLLTEHLGVNHLRLILGASMGAMHTWIWATTFPDFADALMPIASLPVRIFGHNREWRQHAIGSVRDDPGFDKGNYTKPPRGFVSALNTMSAMAGPSSQQSKPAAGEEKDNDLADSAVRKRFETEDPNDFAYALDASWDYDPSPLLHKITAPLTAINSADDKMYPVETGILQEEIEKVRNGRAIVLPDSKNTIGHVTFFIADCWSQHLSDLLDRSKSIEDAKL